MDVLPLVLKTCLFAGIILAILGGLPIAFAMPVLRRRKLHAYLRDQGRCCTWEEALHAVQDGKGIILIVDREPDIADTTWWVKTEEGDELWNATSDTFAHLFENGLPRDERLFLVDSHQEFKDVRKQVGDRVMRVRMIRYRDQASTP